MILVKFEYMDFEGFSVLSQWGFDRLLACARHAFIESDNVELYCGNQYSCFERYEDYMQCLTISNLSIAEAAVIKLAFPYGHGFDCNLDGMY